MFPISVAFYPSHMATDAWNTATWSMRTRCQADAAVLPTLLNFFGDLRNGCWWCCSFLTLCQLHVFLLSARLGSLLETGWCPSVGGKKGKECVGIWAWGVRFIPRKPHSEMRHQMDTGVWSGPHRTCQLPLPMSPCHCIDCGCFHLALSQEERRCLEEKLSRTRTENHSVPFTSGWRTILAIAAWRCLGVFWKWMFHRCYRPPSSSKYSHWWFAEAMSWP